MNDMKNKEVDWRTSENVAQIIDAGVGECVANVLRAFLDHRNLLPEDSDFVEGLYLLDGQLWLHIWIEATDFIIDPTLVRQPKSLLRERILHYKILTRNEDEITRLYGGIDRTPGKRLIMNLDWSDPRVEGLSHEIDPP